jgi:hypothetical protein
MYRFTETNKWVDPWFRKLKAGKKLVFLYLIDNCDNAGFYELDIEMMSFQIGITESDISGAIEGLKRGLIINGNWLWIKNFLQHQKNWPLNSDNNAHKQIINILNSKSDMFKYSKEFKEILGAIKGLKSPIGKGRGKGRGKVEVKTPTYQEFISYGKTIEIYDPCYDFQIKTKFESWVDNSWKDGNDNPIKNWKNKLKSTMVHFKKEFKPKSEPGVKAREEL